MIRNDAELTTHMTTHGYAVLVNKPKFGKFLITSYLVLMLIHYYVNLQNQFCLSNIDAERYFDDTSGIIELF